MASADGSAPLIVVVGATGTGKSELALDIAERLGDRGRPAEVVNADAMQLYRGMDIGTAKLAEVERRGVPHHLLDVLDVTEEASVAAYQPRARRVIDEIRSRGAVPVLVGGSGLYVSGVVFDFAFAGTDTEVRGRLEAEAEENGVAALFARLRDLDAVVAHRIGPYNARRIIRALEIAEITGSPHSALMADDQPLWTRTVLLGLAAPRDVLVNRLDARVERMWASGMLAEIERLVPAGLERGVTASRAIGYSQALAQRAGTLTQEEAIAETQALTRRYARRQTSWFRRYAGLVELPSGGPDTADRAVEAIDGLDAA